jgi:translation initiation factor 4G
MGKGSNVSKANKSREKNAERLAAEGKGGGGKDGMKERKPDNVQEVMKAEQAERERLKKEKEERERLKKEEEEKKQKKLAAEAAKLEAEALAKEKAKKAAT